MPLSLYQIDAFTDRPFAGNPAAVVLLDGPGDEAWMQDVAAEMNLSETAFVRPLKESEDFELRWFTPAAEVELCGHATLASAHVLWETGRLAPEQPAPFRTIHSGLLTATQSGGWINLDFPADPPASVPPPQVPPILAEAFGERPVSVLRSRYDFLCVFDSEQILHRLRPSWAALASLDVRGICVTAKSNDERFDFISRFFAPRLRIDEDPVTGSAHCVLGPYWAERLGRRELTGYQASRRGGVVRVRAEGQRVILGGQAVTILRGDLTA